MPKMNISRRKQIDAPLEKVYNIVSNMKEWQVWSPWLIMDAEAKVKVSDDQKFYSWAGKRVGEGEMKVSAENNKDTVDYDLTFLKPWKSTAKVKMELKPKDGGTEAIWHMDSSIPWFMFWMKTSMEAYVGSDYERGLNLLKDYVENGKIHSQLNHIGFGEYPGCNYIAITRNCAMAESPGQMKADFTKLMEYAKTKEGFRFEDSFSMYHKWDFKTRKVSYTAGIPFDKKPTDLPDGVTIREIPKVKTYTLEHVGPYEHLGNAWSTLYNMHRNKEFKPLKNIHPFETYLNNPEETDPKDLITRVHFAVR